MLIATATMPSTFAQESATPGAEEDPSQPSMDFYPKAEGPGTFLDIELKAGESVSWEVVIANSGDVPFEAITYAADAKSLRNGGFGLNDQDADLTAPTTWVTYPTENVTLGIGDEMERQVELAVPEGTAPGEYVTGLALQTADPANVESGSGMFNFNQYYRRVLPIRVIVPGAMAPALEFGDPEVVNEGGMWAIIVPLANSGNQQALPSGELRLMSSTGEVVLTAPVTMGKVYGGHETEIWIGLSQPLPNGDYTIEVTLEDSDKNVLAELAPTEFAVTIDLAEVEVAQSQISIQEASLTPMPAVDNVQFANVDAVITNMGEPVTNAQLSLIARVDGEEVERFPISQSLSLTDAETAVTTRYMPLTGWTSGEWTFELLLETVDSNGASVVVFSQPLEGTVTIP